MSIAKAQIIGKKGRKEFAVLPYAEYLRLQAALEDYDDLRCLRAAKAAEGTAPTISLAEARRRLIGGDRTARRRHKVRG